MKERIHFTDSAQPLDGMRERSATNNPLQSRRASPKAQKKQMKAQKIRQGSTEGGEQDVPEQPERKSPRKQSILD